MPSSSAAASLAVICIGIYPKTRPIDETRQLDFEQPEARRARSLMSLEEITLSTFAACNSLRVIAYIPQIRKAATDQNGASAISYTTWTLFLLAHLSTVAYAIVNRSDWGLAACFATNAVCCLVIVAVAYCKRRRHTRRQRYGRSLAVGAG
jgi:Flp pilus assembly protein TadB